MNVVEGFFVDALPWDCDIPAGSNRCATQGRDENTDDVVCDHNSHDGVSRISELFFRVESKVELQDRDLDEYRRKKVHVLSKKVVLHHRRKPL